MTIFVAAAAAVCVAAIVYAYHGGHPGRFTGHAKRVRDAGASLLERGKPIAKEAADALAAKARELPVSEIGETVSEALKADTLSRESQPADANGLIRVYFAPADPDRPGELDDAFLDLIRGAEESILCAFFDLEFERAAQVLEAKHRDGITVGIVSDSQYEEGEAIQECIQAGIPVVFDKRNPFMHNKFCVVDGRRVWTGSTNVTFNGFFRNNNNAVLVESKELAANYRAEFLEMYREQAFGGRSPENTPNPVVTVGGVEVECYFAPEDGVEEEILAELDEANESIDCMAFVLTSKPLSKAMAAKMADGVRVRGLFETRGAGSKYSRDEYLAERGAEIHMDTNPKTMHHKVIIIDGRAVVTGSYNFSASAEKKNDENVLIIHSPAVAAHYTKEFERLMN